MLEYRERRRSGGVANVGVFTLAAGGSVGTQRENFNTAIRAGVGVAVGATPRIARDTALGKDQSSR